MCGTYTGIPTIIHAELEFFETKLYICMTDNKPTTPIIPLGNFALNLNFTIKVTPVPNNLLKEYIHLIKKFKMTKHE